MKHDISLDESAEQLRASLATLLTSERQCLIATLRLCRACLESPFLELLRPMALEAIADAQQIMADADRVTGEPAVYKMGWVDPRQGDTGASRRLAALSTLTLKDLLAITAGQSSRPAGPE